MRKKLFTGVAIMVLGLAGCTQSTNALRIDTQAPPRPLPSNPSGTLESSPLQPTGPRVLDPDALQTPGVIGQDGANTTSPSLDTETAALNPDVGNKPVTHETMTGAWNVLSDNPNCRVFLSFTKWSGGYRAGTRRCNEAALASVSAWDIKENQVVLFDANGSRIASLGEIGPESYAGTLLGGKPVTFSR